MEQQIIEKIDAQDKKIDAIYKSVEKTRKYILIVTIVSIGAVVLPLIGLAFAIPSFLSTYSTMLGAGM